MVVQSDPSSCVAKMAGCVPTDPTATQVLELGQETLPRNEPDGAVCAFQVSPSVVCAMSDSPTAVHSVCDTQEMERVGNPESSRLQILPPSLDSTIPEVPPA